MQHAVPMPFGLKLAGYAAALALMSGLWGARRDGIGCVLMGRVAHRAQDVVSRVRLHAVVGPRAEGFLCFFVASYHCEF